MWREDGASGGASLPYWDPVKPYDAYGYSDEVQRVTKRQLKRAANALAGLITSVR